MTPQVMSKGPASAPCTVFCKEFEAPRTAGEGPRSTLCCFLQGFLYPREARSRPCAVFYKHFGAPGTAAGLRHPTATAGTAAKPGGEQRWKTLEPILGHVRKKVSRRRRPKRKRCTVYCFLQGFRNPKRTPREPRWTPKNHHLHAVLFFAKNFEAPRHLR